MSGALTFLIFLPALAALLLLFEKNAKAVRWLAVFITADELIVCLGLYWLRWQGWCSPARTSFTLTISGYPGSGYITRL